jgi:hypothetical protein
MKKRILALILTLFMLMPLAACTLEKAEETTATQEEAKPQNQSSVQKEDADDEFDFSASVPSTSQKPTSNSITKDPFSAPNQSNPVELPTDSGETDSKKEENVSDRFAISEVPYWNKKESESEEVGVLPKGFSVGYGRADMSPQEPVLTYENAITCDIHDPILITCVAVSDGAEVALFYSLDLRQSWSNLVEQSMEIIQRKYEDLGIGKDSMFFTATHNHSSPDGGSPNAKGMAVWIKLYYDKLRECTEEALLDLAPAEAFVGKSNTKDISFVRRFVTAEGKVTTDSSQNVVGYESQPDTELRTIRFARGEKKDVLLVNYQTHYGVATRYFGSVVSADYIHDLRKAAEEELDVHFAYYQGAAGCTVFSAKKGDRVYETYMDAIPAFMTTIKSSISGERKVQTGKIQKEMSYYNGTVRKDDAAVVQKATAINNEKDAEKKQELLKDSGFINAKAAEACVYRNKTLGATVSMPFTAISFGDIAFCSAAYEMFHQNGIQIRDASPFEMTFVCAYTNGSNSYVPAYECTPSGSQYDVKDCYENYATRFVDGSGEEFRDEIVRLLNLCKAAN